MKEGIRFVVFIVIAFVITIVTYIVIKRKADSKKYKAQVDLIKSCNISGVRKINVDAFANAGNDIEITDSVTIGKIISEICNAKPPHAYFQQEQKFPPRCRLHMYTGEGIEFVFRLEKDGSRPLQIEYTPEDFALWRGESEELSFLFN